MPTGDWNYPIKTHYFSDAMGWQPLPLTDLFAPQGWICPRCGRVWSPSMIMCTCKPVATTTSGSTTGTIEEMANDPAALHAGDTVTLNPASTEPTPEDKL